MKRCSTLSTLALIALAVLPATACVAAVAAGAVGAGVYYYEGSLKTQTDAGPKEVASAAAAALEDLDLSVLTERADELTCKVNGKMADGDDVAITAEKQPEGGCRVWIRVGTFGDEAQSQMIWDRMRTHL